MGLNILTLGSSKTYTNLVALGISSAIVDDTNKSITFTLAADGSKHTIHFSQPKDGVSITDIELNTSDELVITFSDGTTKNIGVLPTIKGVSPTIEEDAGNNADVYKLVIKDVNGTITTPNLKATSSGDGSYQLIEKYSDLDTTYIESKIAYVQTDETISSVEYKKGFYEFDVATTTWNYLGEQNNIHSNREVIDKFDESDVLDTDGITVLYKQPTFDSKELLFKTDVGDVNVYAYKTGTTYKKDDIVLNGAILYVALRNTQDTTKITEDDFVAISSNGSTIEEYISGTDYKVGDIVIYDDRLYKCKVEPQVDNTTFDETEWIKLSISNDLEKFLSDFTVVELKEDISNPYLVTGYDLKFKNKELAYREEIKGDTDIYFYQVGVVFTKDSVILKDNVFYIALRDTVDLVSFDDENDFAMIHKLPDTVEIYKYVSGTDYEVGQYVIKDNDIYECIAVQADNTVFDDVNEFKLISNYVLENKDLNYEKLFDSAATPVDDYHGDASKTVTSEYLDKQISLFVPTILDKIQNVFDLTSNMNYITYDTKAELDADVDPTTLSGSIFIYLVKEDENYPRDLGDGEQHYYTTIYICVPKEDASQNTIEFVAKLNISEKLIEKNIEEAINKALYVYTVAHYEVCQSTDDGALLVIDDSSTASDGEIRLSDATPLPDGVNVSIGEYVKFVDSQKTNIAKFVARSEVDVDTLSKLSTIEELQDDGSTKEFLGFNGEKIETELVLDTAPTKDSVNYVNSGAVYSSLFETKQRTVIDTPENYVVCTSSDAGALEVVADDVVPAVTQVTLSVVQAFVSTAQVGEYYQHIDEVSHVEDYEYAIYREKDDSYSSVEVDEKIKEVNDRITEIASGGLKPLSLTDYQSFMDNLVISADGYVAP